MHEEIREMTLEFEAKVKHIEDELESIEKEFGQVIERINSLYAKLHQEREPYRKEDVENSDVSALFTVADYLQQLKEKPIMAVKQRMPTLNFGNGLQNWDKKEMYDTVSFLEEIPRETREGLRTLRESQEDLNIESRDKLILELVLRLQFYREALDSLKKILEAEEE
jgi:hypothetical protein